MSTTSAREIPFARPDFDEAEARAVAAVIATGWVSQGPQVARFESMFAERIGATHAVATPIFADIDPDTWNIDPADVMRRVTPRTKAVIPVHQVGLAADLDAFAPLAARGIAIIEDAACAIGSTYRGRSIGSHGNVA